MNEKRIYEWLRPELKRPLTEWGLQYGVDGPEAAVVDWDASTTKTIPLPPLDYNTLHNEVVPQLRAEGIVIEYDSSSPCPWKFIAGELDWIDTDGYEALDALLGAREAE